MTPEEFAKLFPGRPFAIRYVERGEHKKRGFFWHVVFTNDYWTSDSWRPIYDHCLPSEPDGQGDTLEEALADIVRKTVAAADASRDYCREELDKADRKARELKARLGV